jgi:hypothetical protein
VGVFIPAPPPAPVLIRDPPSRDPPSPDRRLPARSFRILAFGSSLTLRQLRILG